MTIMPEEINDTIKSIKKELRLAMNGVVSTLQRRQGLDYKINFGVEIPRLKGIAEHYTPSYELADRLWKENIRECKILAIFLLPQECYEAVADKWIAETRFTEIADRLAMNVLCKLPDADSRAMQWTSKDEGLFPYCGYLTLSHFMRQGKLPDSKFECGLATRIAALATNECSRPLLNCAYNTLATYIEKVPEAIERILSGITNDKERVKELLDNLV